MTRWQRWRESLKHTYRLVVMNNETFEEVGSYNLTLLNVYVTITSVVVVTVLLVTFTIAFTPLKKYIPGYGDTVQQEELRAIERELAQLQKDFKAQEAYAENFRRILVGEDYLADDMERVGNDTLTVDPEEVPLSEEEIRLRRETEVLLAGSTIQDESGPLSAVGAPLEQHFFVAPVTGEISAAYSIENDHYGVDILAPKNTAIKSVMDGTVFFSDWTQETGNTIGIQHTNSIITFYKHNSELLKPLGSTVKAGEAIAIIGNTGEMTTGPHLHFELWYRGATVDPVQYINF